MIIFFIVLIAVILFSCSRWPKDQWKDGYLSIEQSTSIKGIFAIEIFLGHVFNYIHTSNVLDSSFLSVKSHLDQSVVVMFLLYSGFGMTESLKKKKTSYIFSIPKKRIFPVYTKFLISVLLTVCVEFCLGWRPSLRAILLSVIGWVDLGNYGWYIFVIIVLYFLFMLSFWIGTKNGNDNKAYIMSAGLLTVLSLLFLVLMMYPGRRYQWFYDTILFYPVGVWYSLFKAKIDVLLDNKAHYCFICFVFLMLYISFKLMSFDSFLFLELWYFVFAVVVLLISMRIRIRGRILTFFGRLVFPMLLMQGISYITLDHFGLPKSHPYLFVLAAFAMTVILSLLFSKCTSFIGRKDKIQTKTAPR